MEKISFFKELKQTLKASFSRKQTDLMQELEIEKGIFVGFYYLKFIFFILPFRFIRYTINPTKTLFRGIDRLSFVLLMFVMNFGNENVFARIFENYEKFVFHINSGADAEVKPDLAGVEEIISLVKVRKIFSLFLFSIVILFAYDLLLEILGLFSGIFNIIFTSSALISATDGGLLNNSYDLFANVTIIQIIFYIIGLIAFAYFSYILMIVFKFFVTGIKTVVDNPGKQETEEFLNDVLANVITKTQELYNDKKIAIEAKKAIFENYSFSKQIEYKGV